VKTNKEKGIYVYIHIYLLSKATVFLPQNMKWKKKLKKKKSKVKGAFTLCGIYMFGCLLPVKAHMQSYKDILTIFYYLNLIFSTQIYVYIQVSNLDQSY